MSDEEFDAQENDSEGIKSLRKEYQANKKALSEALEQLSKFQKVERQNAVAGVLKAKGIPEGAAKFYDGDDTSEDAVGKWLEAHADVFQVKSTEQEAPPAQAQPDANTLAAMRVMQQSYGQAPADAGAHSVDPEEKLRLLNSLPTDELVKLGWIPDPKSLIR